MITSVVGVGGTLVGVLVTQSASRRAERDRRRAESRLRWTDERHRIAAEILGIIHTIDLRCMAGFGTIDEDDDRAERLPGYKDIDDIPGGRGVKGIISLYDLNSLRKDLDEAFEESIKLEKLIVEVTLFARGSEAAMMRSLIQSIRVPMGALRRFESVKTVRPLYNDFESKRDKLVAEFRASLNVE